MKNGILMANKYIKRYSTSSVMRESKLKLRYHYWPTEMTKIKRLAVQRFVEEVEQLELSSIADDNVKY